MIDNGSNSGSIREGPHHDLKLTFESESPKAALDLVKDIVAIANSGGGTLTFGRTSTQVHGVSDDVIDALDSARVADMVGRFIPPASIGIAHEIREPEPGKRIVVLCIEPPATPLVISRDAAWRPPGKKHDDLVMRKGDIWVRHSSRNERATVEDIRAWLAGARAAERTAIFERMAMLVNLPDGSSLEVVTRSGSHIDTPTQLIQSARQRRKWDPDHLLSGEDLLWIFGQRLGLLFSEDDLRVLIAAGLRKSATLHLWITLSDQNPSLIVEELRAALTAGDRDKSDAGSNIAELAAFYADDRALREIIDGLRASDYSHFREAAERWHGRIKAQRDSFRRAAAASHQGRPLIEFSQDHLERLATDIASQLGHAKSSSLARKLSNANRVMWARKTGRGSSLQAPPKKT